MQFTEKNVVVTGAANGLGRLFALRFVELGACVAAWDIDEPGLDSLDTEARGRSGVSMSGGPAGGAGRRLWTYVCDLSSPAAIQETVARTLDRLSRVDILVNNAGVVSGAWISDLTDSDVERTFAVNTIGAIHTTRAFLPSMVAYGGGHVVNLASAGGIVGTPRLSDYNASKAALMSFDESLRLEMKRRGLPVATTVIAPFFVGTGMFEGVRTRFRWLLPVLPPERVVERSLEAIFRRRPRLIMPRFVYVTFLARLLPVSWFDALAAFFGITSAMEEFTGRKGGTTDPA